MFSIFAVNNKTSFAELGYVFNNGAVFDGKFCWKYFYSLSKKLALTHWFFFSSLIEK